MLQSGYNRGGLRLITRRFDLFTQIHSLRAACTTLTMVPSFRCVTWSSGPPPTLSDAIAQGGAWAIVADT